MISERVEAQDLKDYKNMMTNRLQEFKGEWNELKHLQLEADNQSACDVVQHSDDDVLKRQLLNECAESLERLCDTACVSGGGNLDSLQTHPTW